MRPAALVLALAGIFIAEAGAQSRGTQIPTGAPFDRGAAASALSIAAQSAQSCKKPGGPTGAGKATVKFAPTGKVESAEIEGPPFAGTSVGGCVAGKFRGAHVPPFSGPPVSISKSFSIS